MRLYMINSKQSNKCMESYVMLISALKVILLKKEEPIENTVYNMYLVSCQIWRRLSLALTNKKKSF